MTGPATPGSPRGAVPGAENLKLILGHSNMDLDSLGSIALARILYPDHRGVASSIVHPAARGVHMMYRDHLDLLPANGLEGAAPDSIVVVDTRSRDRVKEYLDRLASLPTSVTVYDHHPADGSDIPGAEVREGRVGANTTLLGTEVMRRGLAVCSQDATIALTGIYADTGNFTYESVTEEDFRVAGFLVSRGASVELARGFLRTLKEEYQISLVHEVLNHLTLRTIKGTRVVLCRLELERQVAGLAAVVEKVFDLESPDALIALFSFRKEGDTLIVARSRAHGPNLPALLQPFGAAGHRHAVSALRRGDGGTDVMDRLVERLESALVPGVTAADIMSPDVCTAREEWSLFETSLFLEREERTGAPVLDAQGRLSGVVTLRDIMKGRKAGQMKAPVRSYMSHKPVTGLRSTTLREIESLFFRHNIGHLPILDDGRLVGLVTRSDYLRAAGTSEG